MRGGTAVRPALSPGIHPTMKLGGNFFEDLGPGQTLVHPVPRTVTEGDGWREVCVRDPDGYEWAVGVLIAPAVGPAESTT